LQALPRPEDSPPELLVDLVGMALALTRPETSTMLRLTDPQRAVLVHAIPAVANLAVGAMVFGQFLRQQPFSAGLAVAGIGFWFAFVGLTVVVAGGDR
jgi:uncharacterized membrane protein YbjE (DUF340 family)